MIPIVFIFDTTIFSLIENYCLSVILTHLLQFYLRHSSSKKLRNYRKNFLLTKT